MASKRNLRSYFVKTDNTNKETSTTSSQNVFLIIQSSSNITGVTEIQYVYQEIKKKITKPDNVPSKIKQEIGNYALVHGTKAAIDGLSKVCKKYSLRKKSPYSELFWSAFFLHLPAFGLNTERYFVSLRIQSECGKNTDQNNSAYGHFLRSDIHSIFTYYIKPSS